MPKEKWTQSNYLDDGKMCFSTYLLYKKGAGLSYIWNLVLNEENKNNVIDELSIDLELSPTHLIRLIMINDSNPNFEEAQKRAVEYLESIGK